ncbi:MAG: universal stress protein [Thaumarchaeota archaeon]|nr:MAG: universal stress protein [Nitrososphaerota archaeon]TLX86251.1 MAG: universal stress protein [Nitrososphaerota archaeon]
MTMMQKVNDRKTFSKILVAIHDPRKSADRAVNYAIKVAEDYDARLVILYIIRGDANVHTVNLQSHIIQLKREAEAYFIKISEKIHKHSNKENIIRVKTEIIASIRIADAIVSYAKDKHIDLIIIGTRGRSKLKSIVLGSVALDVVRHAHCPVLTVK